jgi:tetratricopeptide (TPR) repeat protein
MATAAWHLPPFVFYTLTIGGGALVLGTLALWVMLKWFQAPLVQGLFAFSKHNEQVGNYRLALLVMEQAFRLKPASLPVLYRLGALHQHLDNPAQALDYYYLVQLQAPEHAACAYNIGVAEYAMGRYDIAIAQWFSAIQNTETPDADMYYNLGAAYEALEDWPAAVEVYTQGLALEATNADMLESLAYALLQDGKAEQALPHMETLLNLRPTAETYALQGLIHAELGQLSEALEAYELALEQDEQNPEYRNNLAVLMAMQPTPPLDLAAEALHTIAGTEATGAYELRALALYNLSMVQGMQQHFEQARDTLRELLAYPLEPEWQPSVALAQQMLQAGT